MYVLSGLLSSSERQRERTPFCWFSPLVVGPAWGWTATEATLGVQSRFPTWMAGTQLPKLSLLPPKVPISRNRSQEWEPAATAWAVWMTSWPDQMLMVTFVYSVATHSVLASPLVSCLSGCPGSPQTVFSRIQIWACGKHLLYNQANWCLCSLIGCVNYRKKIEDVINLVHVPLVFKEGLRGFSLPS